MEKSRDRYGGDGDGDGFGFGWVRVGVGDLGEVGVGCRVRMAQHGNSVEWWHVAWWCGVVWCRIVWVRVA